MLYKSAPHSAAPRATMSSTDQLTRSNFSSNAPQEKPTKTKLVTLPPELFERVAQNLKARDLTNLRLVNREAAEKVLRTYKDVCFHTISILPNKSNSVQAAIALAKNSTLTSAIERVRIYIDKKLPKAQAIGYDICSPFEMAQLTKFFLLLDTDHPRDMGIEILDLPSIVARGGRLSGTSKLSQLGELVPPQLDSTPFTNIMAAFDASSLVLRELSVGGKKWALPTHLVKNEFPSQWSAAILKPVKRLSLGIWTKYSHGFTNIADFIQQAEQLEFLSVCNTWLESRLCANGGFVGAMRKKSLPKLQEFELKEDFYCPVEHFVAFVRNQPLLTRVKVQDCYFTTDFNLMPEKKPLQDELRRLTGLKDLEVDKCTEEKWQS